MCVAHCVRYDNCPSESPDIKYYGICSKFYFINKKEWKAVTLGFSDCGVKTGWKDDRPDQDEYVLLCKALGIEVDPKLIGKHKEQ